MTEKGWTKISGDDVGELHYKYFPPGVVHPAAGSDPVKE